MVKTQPASGVDELLRAAEILDNWDREREHGYAAVAPRNSNNEGSDSASGENSSLVSGSSALARACGNTGNSGVVAAVMGKNHGRRRRHSASCSSPSNRRLSTSSTSPDQKARGSGKESVQNGFVRSAHNELEKSRRASMRSCLEALRHLLPNEHLERTSTGKNTTLSVLRSARSFIKALHDCLDQKSDTRAQLMSEQTKKLHRLSVLTGMATPNGAAGSSSNPGATGLETLGTAAVAVAAAQAAAVAAASGGSEQSSTSPIPEDRISIEQVVNNFGSFDSSPPVSLVKPVLPSTQLPRKANGKTRSISENSTFNLIPVPKVEKQIKEDDDGKTETLCPTRVVFVSSINEGNDHLQANTVSNCALTTVKQP